MLHRCCLTLFCPASQDDFSIEYAKASDEATIRFIAETTSNEIYGAPYDSRKYHALFREFNQPGAVYLVALLEGSVIGFAKLLISEDDKGKTAKLDKLYFLAEYRNKGYGSRMLERCIQEAVERGADRMTLVVWAGNPRAIAFYKRNYFHCPGLLPVVVIDDRELNGDTNFLYVRENLSAQLKNQRLSLRK